MLPTLCLSLVLVQNQTPPAPPTSPVAPPATAAQTGVDRSTPEATIRSFFKAFMRGDLKSAVTCVRGAVDSPVFRELEAQIKKSPAPYSLEAVAATANGEDATANLKIRSSVPGQAGSLLDDKITLKRRDGSWQIVPDNIRKLQPESANQTRIFSILTAAIANPHVLDEGRRKARETSILSNIKQIALGALMFVQDHDGKFALKAATYKKSLMPYIKNEAIFHATGDTSKTESYTFNPYLQGATFTSLKSPTTTVMIYEGRGMQLTFRHHGMAAVAYVDGHAQLITPAQAKTLRWKP